MTFHHVDEACKMHWAYIVLILLLTCVVGSVILDDSRCNYVYNHECRASRNVPAGIEYKGAATRGSCSVDDIGDDVKFTVQLAKDHPRSSGIAKVNFSLPNVECNYEVALLVDSTIKNDKDCKNHVFHKTNSYEDEIHSSERTVCVLPITNLTAANNCQDKFSMWYEHVFTGCYALRFTVDGYKYSVIGNQFIVTDYTRKEVTEPKFRCYYEDRINDEPSKQELVTFALSISVNADTAGMILTLTPISYLDETKENACVRYSQQALYTWEISTRESASFAAAGSKNCSLTTVRLNSETYTRDTECNFDLRASTRNVSYCLKIELDDERCNRQTIWKPPPDDKGGKPACAWLQSCARIVKNTSIIEYSGISHGIKRTSATDNNNNIFLLLPIIVIAVIIILAIIATVLFLRRVYLRYSTSPIYANTNLRDLEIARCGMEIECVETYADEMTRSTIIVESKDANYENEPIILIYARGPISFMNLMTDFREIIKIRCGCRVRDWYDASEWDDVARIGASSWITDLLRNEHRAIWIDTPRARNIFNSQWRRNNNSSDVRLYSFDDYNTTRERVISDFRDFALPIVLDFAKRNVPQLGYKKHFVVRLEGFDASNGSEMDPFEILSPHTRYLIPHHLGELCSHLSNFPTNIHSQQSSIIEEAQLRERLVRMRNKSPSLETLH